MESIDSVFAKATRILQQNYVRTCTGYQEKLRTGARNLEDWLQYQQQLVSSAIQEIEKRIKIKYWNYFFNPGHRRLSDFDSTKQGKIYYHNKDHEWSKFFDLWQTSDGRSVLRKAGVPRLADLFKCDTEAQTNRYLVSTELPRVFVFDTASRCCAINRVGFQLTVPMAVQESISSCFNEIRGNRGEPGTVLLKYMERVMSMEPEMRSLLIDAFKDGLSKIVADQHELVQAIASDRAAKLLRYLAWLTAALGDDKPVLALYFTGTAGYSTLPDIGCAVGLADDLPDGVEMTDFAAFIDLSLYYSMQPFAPVFEEFSLRHREASRRAARAAVMSRNFSHNVGSHSLANPRLQESVGIKGLPSKFDDLRIAIEQRLSTFHGYAQGRLDFLARAISDSGNRPEPLFFLNDVLEGGLFRQGVLLDTLIQDQGFAAAAIEFHVCIQKTDKAGFGVATYTWQEDGVGRHQFIRGAHGSIEDVVVGIPGGMIGAHSLYAFLENAMRNAVKYGGEMRDGTGRKKPETLKIFLRLEQCDALLRGQPKAQPKAGWVLSVWDNVSSDPDGKAATDIRRHINADLIDETTGLMRPQGHGIQEMKLCAELLAGGEHGLCFPADHEYHAVDPRCAHCPNSCTASQEYVKHGKTDLLSAITERQPLRCYSSPHKEIAESGSQSPTRWLTYNLFMPIPVLLGVVSVKHADNVKSRLPPHVRYFKTLEELADSGSHLGVLLDDNMVDRSETVSKIARLHPCLPFRLMILAGSASDQSQWIDALLTRVKPSGSHFKYPQHIPPFRTRVCGPELGKSLYQLLSTPQASGEERYLSAGGANETRWDAIVLRAYDAWLRVFKPLPSNVTNWKLCIGFEHGGKAVADRWTRPLKAFSADTENAACIGVYVVSKKDKEDTDPERLFSGNWNLSLRNAAELKAALKLEQVADGQAKQFLVFDNHGDVFKDFKGYQCGYGEGVRFYQKIGLKEGLTLYQSLESPPSSSFGFALFIYSLAEGCLTRVAILDERVAQATMEGDIMFRGSLHLYHSANLFPLFRFCRNNSSAKQVFISNRLEAAVVKRAESWIESGGDAKDWAALLDGDNGEGMHYGDDPRYVAVVSRNGVPKALNVNDIDILVIHEGVADRLHSEKVWQRSETAGLFGAAPFVVRTSGRGQESRHMRNILPFLEFSELSENTYQGLNKVSLAKGLLGTTGSPQILAKEDPPL